MPRRWEVTGCYYGINAATFEVERVVRRRGGMLSISRNDVIQVRLLADNPVGPIELRYLFGLSDVAFISVDCMGTIFESKVQAKLRALAEHYRQEAA